jgi:hypothetical protein
MMDKPKRRKLSRKQREVKRAAQAKIFEEGFNQGYDMGVRVTLKEVEKHCRHNCPMGG